VGDDEAHAAVLLQQRPQQRARLGPPLHVEGGERLVEQQQARLGGQRPRQRRALRLPAGELLRAPPGDVGEPQALQPDIGPGASRPARQASRDQAVGHVVADALTREQAEILEHQPDLALLRQQPDPRLGILEHAAVELDAPARERNQSRQRFDQRRFPRPVRPDEHDRLARARLELRLEPEAVALHAETGSQAHPSRLQPRTGPSTSTETPSSRQPSRKASAGRVWSVS
jgi:hypothetical protein